MTVHLDLHRTFLPAKNNAQGMEEMDMVRWASGAKDELEWTEVLSDRVVVVLGEPGMGKTCEFNDQANRDLAANLASFLIPLNFVAVNGEVALALADEAREKFNQWLVNGGPARFYLDAVDEARLVNQPALLGALRRIVEALRPHLADVSFVISSRIADWQVDAVRQAVETAIVAPLNSAIARRARVLEAAPGTADQPASAAASGQPNLQETQKAAPPAEMKAYLLAPLSVSEAKRLAAAHGAEPVDLFWREVEDGDFQRLARRPRDLEWMARRWISAEPKTLGSYFELLDYAIEEHLTEKNDHYVTAHMLMSMDQLRLGSEALAAASVFCDRPFIAPPENPDNAGLSLVVPGDVLPQFDQLAQGRVLGAALYDWAAFRQFRFRHSTREFLAAAWVDKRLAEGLPFDQAMTLFGGEAYGKSVLINSRRSTLCWLTALNTPVRDHVVKHFPEMLMFEGDPTRWSTEDVAEAFGRYVDALDGGFLPNWWNDISELRRVARCIPSDLLNATLRKYPESPKVTDKILALIRFGAVKDCAATVFKLFQTAKDEDYRQGFLMALSAIATTDHKAKIHAQLVSGKWTSGGLIAAALSVVDTGSLSVAELRDIFRRVVGEDSYGSGPVQQAIRYSVLVRGDAHTANRVLEALMQCVPVESDGQPVVPEGAPDGKHAWKYNLLPSVLLAVVEALDESSGTASPLVVEAYLLARRAADGGYSLDGTMERLNKLLRKNAALRRAVMFAGSQPAQTKFPSRRKMAFFELIFNLDEDLEWIVDESGRSDLRPEDRWVWFELGGMMAAPWDAPQRPDMIARLISSVPTEAGARKAWFEAQDKHRDDYLRAKADRENRENAKLAEKAKNDGKSRQVFLGKLTTVRDGTNVDLFSWLLQNFPVSRERVTYSTISLNEVANRLGEDVAAAVSAGLEAVWNTISPPNVTAYVRTQVPWLGLLGLASLNHRLASGAQPESFSDADIRKIARLSVWDIEGASGVLKALCESKPAMIYDELGPWAEHELKTHTGEQGLPRTVELLLNCPAPVRERLLSVAVRLLCGNLIPSTAIQARVLPEAFKLHLIDKVALGTMAKARLHQKHEVVAVHRKQEWLNTWIYYDLPAAWAWIEGHGLSTDAQKEELAACLVQVMIGKWAESLTGTSAEIHALRTIFVFLAPYLELPLEGSKPGGWHRVSQLREAIARALASFPGAEANQVVEELAQDPAIPDYRRAWLRSLALEQATRHAEASQRLTPKELMAIGEGYRREPQTEPELLVQVMSRLKEIKDGVEAGPFSDRDLFSDETKEKQLQLWLAARLHDTPRRRFTARFGVIREPEVDDDKRTDIEVSTRGFKVCIEIKPAIGSKYSTRDLVKTLSDQLVARYLKRGRNSKNGILVVFRLDEKTWHLPTKKGASFDELIAYLNQEAEKICKRTGIETLRVVGIDCVDRSLLTVAAV